MPPVSPSKGDLFRPPCRSLLMSISARSRCGALHFALPTWRPSSQRVWWFSSLDSKSTPAEPGPDLSQCVGRILSAVNGPLAVLTCLQFGARQRRGYGDLARVQSTVRPVAPSSPPDPVVGDSLVCKHPGQETKIAGQTQGLGSLHLANRRRQAKLE